MPFQIHALPKEPFAPLFDLSDTDLAERHAVRKIASGSGEPCRVSLTEAEAGETIILTHYQHQAGNTPYRASHALFVREKASQATPAVGEVPELLLSRLISLRGFSQDDTLLRADVSPGTELDGAIDQIFADADVAYIHLHNAKEGCYHARVTRAA